MGKRGIHFSGADLKLIALISMFCDHIAVALLGFQIGKNELQSHPFSFGMALDASYSKELISYWVLRSIGRLAFPIFAYLLVEGFQKTRSRKNYLCKLVAFAFFSEIPLNLAFSDSIFYAEKQNVFWTLALGLSCMWLCEYFDGAFGRLEDGADRMGRQLLIFAAGAALAQFFKTDYGACGVIAIACIYLFKSYGRERFAPMGFACLSLFLLGDLQLMALPDLLLVDAYDGQRGRQMKYFFYLFYPGHLMVLYLLRRFILV